MSAPLSPTEWRQIHWQRPLAPDAAAGLLRQWSADQRSPRLVLEATADAGVVRYLIGGSTPALRDVKRLLTQLSPGTLLTPKAERAAVAASGRLAASTRHRALGRSDAEAAVRALLSGLAQVETGQSAVVQLVLGPRRIPLSVPTQSPSSIVRPWYETAWHGKGGTVDSEKRTALRDKVSDHGFACTVRLGVTAPSREARRRLLFGLLAALRTSEAPGLKLRLIAESPSRLNAATAPRLFWPLRLNISEALVMTGWPLGDRSLPGQPALHPKALPPSSPARPPRDARVVARATAPGVDADLVLGARDALHHTHILGPTGTGKSVLLARLIAQDLAAGRSVVVIEPKDLVADVLTQVPADRFDDVVVIDPMDPRPVGFNPLLRTAGTSPELVADNLLSVFKALYSDSWGPRLQDILHASLLTLAQRDDASLIMLPLLLTNTGFRRSLTSSLRDPIGLGPFWAWYEALSDAERAAVIAPVMNKLRQVLLRPSLRAVLGQREPAFDVSEVFTSPKVLLVPLHAGVLGPEAAGLLGSLVVSRLWQCTLARTNVPASKRRPVMVYIDEVQNYLHLAQDLGEALAEARGLGVAFHLAHQYLNQLPPPMRAAVFTNARSRIAFQLTTDDAVALAKGHPELAPDDFTALGQYELYASLFAGGRSTPYVSGRSQPPEPAISDARQLRRRSARRYGRDVGEVEAGFQALLDEHAAPAPDSGRRPRRQP